jgi:hypothetical protein
MFSVIWAKFGKWFAAIAAFAVMLASVFYAGRKAGGTKAEANAANERANDREAIAVRQVNEAREASEQQVKAVQNAKDVASDNSTFDDDEVTKRLRDEWSRD